MINATGGKSLRKSGMQIPSGEKNGKIRLPNGLTCIENRDTCNKAEAQVKWMGPKGQVCALDDPGNGL